MLETLARLRDTETEFPIKVEGTSTLPYTSQIEHILPATGELILKLVRPLPHELLSGAVFRMVFAMEDQRYEALITYGRRESYLHYRFSMPDQLTHSDRRRYKRYPFRPRESAYVIASDGGIPGLGIAGSLANIGVGGFCMRVDRVLRLEDGLRVPVNTALFERGASFPRIRIQDLPLMPLLEVAGWITHTSDRGEGILLGFNFGELPEGLAKGLAESLAFREKMFHGRSGPLPSESSPIRRPDTGSHSRRPAQRTPVEGDMPEEEASCSESAPADPRLPLRRKAARLALIGLEGALQRRCREGLWRHGYHRIEWVPDCGSACAAWAVPDHPKPVLALLLLETEEDEPLAGVRRIEKQMVLLGDVPSVILCAGMDPTLFLSQNAGTRYLACTEDTTAWIAGLDTLLGFEAL